MQPIFVCWHCILLLCWICLLIINSFFVESLGFLHIRSYHLQRDNFTSSFPVRVPFISSCLIPLARTSSTMLNRSGKSSCLCLFPGLKGKAFSLSPLSMIFTMCFHMWFLLCEVNFLLFLVRWAFLSWRGIEFCQVLFLHQSRCLCDFSSSFC